MTDTRDSRMAYTVTHEAWYWSTARNIFDDRVVAEVGIQREPLDPDGRPAGGVFWEFNIRWFDLHRGEHWRSDPLAPRLELFGDSWQAFHEIPEFFGQLASLGQDPTPEDVIATLDRLGWTDVTDRQRRECVR